MMALKSPTESYGSIALLLHWGTVLLVLGLMASGLALQFVPEALKINLFKWHLSMALVLLLVTLLRLGWWFIDTKPPTLAAANWQKRLSSVVHKLLYLLSLLAIASGGGLFISSGVAEELFRNQLASLPNFWEYPPRSAHRVAVIALSLVIGLHLFGVCYHHYWRKDKLLSRMSLFH